MKQIDKYISDISKSNQNHLLRIQVKVAIGSLILTAGISIPLWVLMGPVSLVPSLLTLVVLQRGGYRLALRHELYQSAEYKNVRTLLSDITILHAFVQSKAFTPIRAQATDMGREGYEISPLLMLDQITDLLKGISPQALFHNKELLTSLINQTATLIEQIFHSEENNTALLTFLQTLNYTANAIAFSDADIPSNEKPLALNLEKSQLKADDSLETMEPNIHPLSRYATMISGGADLTCRFLSTAFLVGIYVASYTDDPAEIYSLAIYAAVLTVYNTYHCMVDTDAMRVTQSYLRSTQSGFRYLLSLFKQRGQGHLPLIEEEEAASDVAASSVVEISEKMHQNM